MAMARRLSAVAGLLSLALMLGVLTTPVHAQPAPWLADKGYENGIPIGTKITQANWQQYQQFMPESMVHLFKGDLFWHMPQGVELDVGPTRHLFPPKPFKEDTEKYGSQTSLIKNSDGGYVPKGYESGFPFANPMAGDKAELGAKMYYNNYYRPAPVVEEAPNCSYTLDKYANFTRTADSNIVFSQLTHLSEPGYPKEIPGNNGYFFAAYFEQTAPEQGKYFASVDMTWNDPSRVDELYEYIPSLRRSLRVSQAARCAPLFGTDFTYEDAQEGAPRMGNLFDNQLIGEKKILTLMHGAPASFDTCGTPTSLDPPVLLLWSQRRSSLSESWFGTMGGPRCIYAADDAASLAVPRLLLRQAPVVPRQGKLFSRPHGSVGSGGKPLQVDRRVCLSGDSSRSWLGGSGGDYNRTQHGLCREFPGSARDSVYRPARMRGPRVRCPGVLKHRPVRAA